MLPADDPERQALEEARPHAGTSKLLYLDPFGRVAAQLQQGGSTAADRPNEAIADIQARPLQIVDPRGLSAFRYRHDMLGRVVQQDSADAGQSFALMDGYGRQALAWDARGFAIRCGYDLADRTLFVEVTGGDGAAPLDHRVAEFVYGEQLADGADARLRNLLGRVAISRDGAWELRVDRYDPAGATLSTTRQLRADPTSEPDWRATVALDSGMVTTVATFDALGRLRSDTLADGSARAYEYDTDGTLARVRLTTPDGKINSLAVLDGTTHGPDGALSALALGNGVQLAFQYDPPSRRLIQQSATRAGAKLQQIGYTYDPVGNIVRIADAAQEGAGAVIVGITVPARRDQSYDAHYRLLQASGRVHQALLQWDTIPGTAGTVKGTRLVSLNDGQAVERYVQNFSYDASGNLTRVRYAGTTRSWTTDFWISASSNRSLAALDPNGNAVASPDAQFDAAGNLRALPNLRQMGWTWDGSLGRAVVIARPGSTDDAELYRYDANGRRVLRQTTRLIQPGLIEVIEKIYFGDAERKRISRNGAVVLERWTLHIGDGERRLAVVHRWTKDDRRREVDDIGPPSIRYQLHAVQNSAVMELDETGKLIAYEEYFPYGQTAFLAGDDAREVDRREYRYSAKECDDFTGLYYYGFRYLVPWLGRWLSPDPSGPSDDLNLYQFVLGDPVGNSDPDGQQTARPGEVIYINQAPPAPADTREGHISAFRNHLAPLYRSGFDSSSAADQDRLANGTTQQWLVPTDPNAPTGASGWSVISTEEYSTHWLPARQEYARQHNRPVHVMVSSGNPNRMGASGMSTGNHPPETPPPPGWQPAQGAGGKTDPPGSAGAGRTPGDVETNRSGQRSGDGDGGRGHGRGHGDGGQGRAGSGGKDVGQGQGQGGGTGPGRGRVRGVGTDPSDTYGDQLGGMRGGAPNGQMGGTAFSPGHTPGGTGRAPEGPLGRGGIGLMADDRPAAKAKAALDRDQPARRGGTQRPGSGPIARSPSRRSRPRRARRPPMARDRRRFPRPSRFGAERSRAQLRREGCAARHGGHPQLRIRPGQSERP